MAKVVKFGNIDSKEVGPPSGLRTICHACRAQLVTEEKELWRSSKDVFGHVGWYIICPACNCSAVFVADPIRNGKGKM